MCVADLLDEPLRSAAGRRRSRPALPAVPAELRRPLQWSLGQFHRRGFPQQRHRIHQHLGAHHRQVRLNCAATKASTPPSLPSHYPFHCCAWFLHWTSYSTSRLLSRSISPHLRAFRYNWSYEERSYSPNLNQLEWAIHCSDFLTLKNVSKHVKTGEISQVRSFRGVSKKLQIFVPYERNNIKKQLF